MWQNIQKNWKTSLIAAVTFVYTVPQAVTCVQNWSNHQSCDWHQAVYGLLIALAAAMSKDYDNHSTQGDINKATAKQNGTNVVHWNTPGQDPHN
jgi:hypothetical protein